MRSGVIDEAAQILGDELRLFRIELVLTRRL